MKPTPKSSQLRRKAALAVVASRSAGNTVDRDDLLMRAKGLEILASAEEWLDDGRTIPAGTSRTT
jgi:hypothetical protein